MLILATVAAFASVALAVTAILWPSPRPMHLRPLRKAYTRPLTLMGHPTPPRVDDAWGNVFGEPEPVNKPIVLRGVVVGYEPAE